MSVSGTYWTKLKAEEGGTDLKLVFILISLQYIPVCSFIYLFICRTGTEFHWLTLRENLASQ